MKFIQRTSFLLLFFQNLLFAQTKIDRDVIICATIYDEMFKGINPSVETEIGAYLNNKSLAELLAEGIISRGENYRDLTLPLGIHRRTTNINFTQGMLDMWKAKADYVKKQNSKIEGAVLKTALESIEALTMKPTKTNSLIEYRNEIMEPACAKMRKFHGDMQKLYTPERKLFMDMIAENLSPNVLLGYNIQELMPPTFVTKKGEKSINPIFKAYYLDCLLREAGYEFICFFPARHDALHSFGPFQFTDIALKDILENGRLIDSFKIFKNMDTLKQIEKQAMAAAFFAYNNWERLSFILQSNKTLTKFNEYFSDYAQNEDKKRQIRIFIAGVSACMHHKPSQTFELVKKHLSSSLSLENIHCAWVTSDKKQLYKYHRSAAEAYLILKVYNKLFEED